MKSNFSSPCQKLLILSMMLAVLGSLVCTDQGKDLNSNIAPRVTSPDSIVAIWRFNLTYHASAIDPKGHALATSFINYPSWLSPSGDSISGMVPSGATDTSFAVTASNNQLADTLDVFVHVSETYISFSHRILPVLNLHCGVSSGCHTGPSPFGRLALDSYAHVISGGRSGPIVIPFEPDRSLLIKRIKGVITPRMPLSGSPLPDSTIGLFRDWILEGALAD
jgi:hypothetical protein